MRPSENIKQAAQAAKVERLNAALAAYRAAKVEGRVRSVTAKPA